MNKTILFAAASMTALLFTAASAQEKQAPNNDFVTLDLNWTEGGAPAESGLDGDTMRQILERDIVMLCGVVDPPADGADVFLHAGSFRASPALRFHAALRRLGENIPNSLGRRQCPLATGAGFMLYYAPLSAMGK